MTEKALNKANQSQNPQEAEGAFRIKSRPRRDNSKLVELHVEGKWRRSKWYDRFCFHCDRERSRAVELEWWGKMTRWGRVEFWARCPECGWRSQPYCVGWRPPKPGTINQWGHVQGVKPRLACWL